MQNTERDLKLYYSISEVAQMFDVNESLLRFWERSSRRYPQRKGVVACASIGKRMWKPFA